MSILPFETLQEIFVTLYKYKTKVILNYNPRVMRSLLTELWELLWKKYVFGIYFLFWILYTSSEKMVYDKNVYFFMNNQTNKIRTFF